jgi:N-acetyl-gamma-glutamyl-phosphate reductase
LNEDITMLQVTIVGCGGYGGVGAVELLLGHPQARVAALLDVNDVGKKLSDLYPHLGGLCDMTIVHPDQDKTESDVVFFATPDGVGMKNAATYLARGMKVVDYSGDFRFDTVEAYREYATRIGLSPDHAAPDLLARTAYGICELHRDRIAKASIVGNPGCFAVSAILGAHPIVKNGLVDTATLVIDAKTGVSGAGKKVNPVWHYPHRYEEMNAYKIAKHQHVMEIERELSVAANKPVNVTLVTQVVPVTRGIMTCIYAKAAAGVSYDTLLDAYRSSYANEPFVRVFGEKETAGNRTIRGSNRCALWVNLDRRTGTVIVVSHIDNLVKGQAGSAVQCMNAMFGIDETAGLRSPGAYP